MRSLHQQTALKKTRRDDAAVDTAASAPRLRDPHTRWIDLQHTLGNQAVYHLLQANDKESAQPDGLEQQAQRTAEQVVGNAPPAVVKPVPEAPAVQAQPVADSATEEGQTPESEAPSLADASPRLRTLAGGAAEPPPDAPSGPGYLGAGVALRPQLRNYFEERFGRDFSTVRLHTGDRSAALSRALQARAFTSGNHIVFGPDEYAPDTLDGRRLIAHELTHVLQQRHQTAAGIQRHPIAAPAEEIDVARPIAGAQVRIERLRTGGQARVVVQENMEWVHLTWDPRHGQNVTITIATNLPPGEEITVDALAYGLRVEAAFPVAIHLNRAVEDQRPDFMPVMFSYDLQVRGTMTTETGPYSGPRRFREYYIPRPDRERGQINPIPHPDLIDPFGPLRNSQDRRRQDEQLEERLEDYVAGHPSFDDWRAMEAYIRENRQQSFVGMLLPNGRFVARRISERDLQRLADLARQGELEPEEADFEGQQPAFFSITGVYIRGRAIPLHDLDQLRDQYYADPFSAFLGYGATAVQETEVYRMGDGSFGRRVLSHSQALARWRELDQYTADTIGSVETLPGHQFVSLFVFTARGLVELDERYFRGRDIFYANADQINERAEGIVGADLLVGRRLANPAVALLLFYSENQSAAPDVRYFLQAELYREQQDPRFRQALQEREPLAASIAATLYERAAARARHLVLNAIDGSIEDLQPLVDDRNRLREFVRGLPSMEAEQRRQMLVSLGVPARHQTHVARILGDPVRAANVALGEEERESTEYQQYQPDLGGGLISTTETFTTVLSLDRLRDWAGDQLDGLREFRESVADGDTDPLNVQGDLGNEVRRQIYREMGFTGLHPEDFPHDNATSQFMPGPLAATTLQFETLAEQLFANHAARNEDVAFVRLIGKITAMVIAMVALALISGGIGSAVAGAFGFTGILGAAVEVGVAALSFTLISELAYLLITGETQSEDLLDFFGHLAANTAMFGIFRALQPVIAATTEALMATRGFGTAVRATVGARAGTHIVHTGVEFMPFLAFGLGNFMLQHERMPQSGREWFLLVYESALTAVLMRAGSILARPVMEDIGVWARSRRLGAMEEPLNEFRGDALRLERDFQTLISSRPDRIAAEGPAMAERTVLLLQRQARMLEQLREHFRTRNDAEAVRQVGEELQAIQSMVDTMNRLGGLGALNMRPVGEAGSVFTYRPNPQAIEHLRAIYGEQNVSVDAEGRVHIRVEAAGQITDLTLMPEALQTQAQALATQQLTLTERMQQLGSRADVFDVEPEALTRVRGTRDAESGRRTGGIRPGARRTPEAIQQAEQMITEAETAVEAQVSRIATRSYRLFRRVPQRAAALAQARQGELATLTDAQVGEAIHLFVYRAQARSGAAVERVRTIYNLGPRELRGVLFAYREGVNLSRLRGRVRNVSVEQRNFALDTYARMMEMRIEGATDVLNEMVQSNNKFDGGVYAMEFARFEIGLERVARMERAEINPNRIVDIILTDGTRVELKAWNRWQHGSLEWQFEKDVFEVCGQDFANPTAIQRLWYVFRPPSPLQVPEIRSRLRTRLENMLERQGVSFTVRQEMLSQFDMHANMVREGTITRSGRRAPEPVQVAEPPPPPPTGTEEVEEVEEEQ